MTTSVMLRLLPTARTGGRLAGRVEVVETGEVTPFRDADDLVSVLRRIHGDMAVIRPAASDDTSLPPAGNGDSTTAGRR
jgi:hypothetical protein